MRLNIKYFQMLIFLGEMSFYIFYPMLYCYICLFLINLKDFSVLQCSYYYFFFFYMFGNPPSFEFWPALYYRNQQDMILYFSRSFAVTTFMWSSAANQLHPSETLIWELVMQRRGERGGFVLIMWQLKQCQQ